MYYLIPLYLLVVCRPRTSPLFPYTTLFRSECARRDVARAEFLEQDRARGDGAGASVLTVHQLRDLERQVQGIRSEEHTSELQSQSNLVCRLLLEKKKQIPIQNFVSIVFLFT